MIPIAGAALIAAPGRKPDFASVDPDVLSRWEKVQAGFGKDVAVRSAYRDPTQNRNARGAKRSQHMHGKALDIDVAGMPIADRLRMIRLASDAGFTGIGVYNNTLHFDTGPRRFWGPTYRSASLPGWAKDTIAIHMAGGWKVSGDAPPAEAKAEDGPPADFSKVPREALEKTYAAGVEKRADMPESVMAKMDAPATSPYFRKLVEGMKAEEPATPAAALPAWAGGASVAPTAPAADVPVKSPYFRQLMDEQRREREGPDVVKEAPAAPADMSVPPAKSWLARQVEGAAKLVGGDAEFDVPELGNEMRAGNMGGPPGISWMAPDKSRKGVAKLVEDEIRKAFPGATDEEVNKRWNDLEAGLAMAENEAAMANMVRKAVPGAEIIKDKAGNLYADIGGQRFALDKSGISARDIMIEAPQFAGAAMGAMGAAGAGRAIGGFIGAGGLGRVAGAGLGAAGEVVAENTISNLFGGNQPLSDERVLMAAAFGVGGEAAGALIERVGPALWGAITRARAASRTEAQFRQRLRAQGYDEQAINDAIAGFLRQSDPRWDGDALARIFDARSLPVPIELTRGQATRDLGTWRAEDRLRNVTVDSPEARFANEVANEQQRSLGRNAAAMMEGLGGLPDRAGRGAVLQGDLAARRRAAEAAVDAAYDAARNVGRADVSVATVRNFVGNLRDRLRRDLTPSEFTSARELLGELEEIVNNPHTTGIAVEYLERWRSKVTRRANSTADGGERYGLNAMRDMYDRASVGMFRGNLIKGDPEAITAWRNAVAERRRFGRTWESDNILNKLTVLKNDRTGEMRIDTGDVMNELLTGKNVAREVRRLRHALGGEDSAAFRQIKVDALERLFGNKPVRDAMERGDTFPVDLVRNLGKMRRENRALYDELFTSAERSVLERFARTVKTINIKPSVGGQMNRSESGYTIEFASSEALRSFLRLLNGISNTPAGALINGWLRQHIDNAVTANTNAAIARSIEGMPPPTPPRPSLPGLGGAVGGAYGGWADTP